MTRAECVGKIAIICYLNNMELSVDDNGAIKVSIKFKIGLVAQRVVSYSEKMPTGYTVECVEELATRYSNKETADEIESAIEQFKPF